MFLTGASLVYSVLTADTLMNGPSLAGPRQGLFVREGLWILASDLRMSAPSHACPSEATHVFHHWIWKPRCNEAHHWG